MNSFVRICGGFPWEICVTGCKLLSVTTGLMTSIGYVAALAALWVVPAETRRESVPGASSTNFLFVTVSAGTTHIPAPVQWILMEAVTSNLGANSLRSNVLFNPHESLAAAGAQ